MERTTGTPWTCRVCASGWGGVVGGRQHSVPLNHAMRACRTMWGAHTCGMPSALPCVWRVVCRKLRCDEASGSVCTWCLSGSGAKQGCCQHCSHRPTGCRAEPSAGCMQRCHALALAVCHQLQVRPCPWTTAFEHPVPGGAAVGPLTSPPRWGARARHTRTRLGGCCAPWHDTSSCAGTSPHPADPMSSTSAPCSGEQCKPLLRLVCTNPSGTLQLLACDWFGCSAFSPFCHGLFVDLPILIVHYSRIWRGLLLC